MGDFNITAWIGNTLSPLTIFGVVIGWFPTIAIAMAIFWYAIQLYEWRGTQNMIANRRVRKIARLRIEVARLEALERLHNPINRTALLPAKVAAEALVLEAREQARIILEEAKQAHQVAPDEKH